MGVGKSTVQLSHVINDITVCEPGEDTLLQTEMIGDLPVTSPTNLNSCFSAKTVSFKVFYSAQFRIISEQSSD